MNAAARQFVIVGALLLAVATGLGAWAAHGLERFLDAAAVGTFRTGVEYHFYHGLGILLIAALIQLMPGNRLLQISAWLLTAGIFAFSGSLYLLAFGTARFLGPVTPLGGLCFIAGWLCLVAAMLGKTGKGLKP